MPDAPDNYHLLPDSERHLLTDVGELAARQNPLFGFDRRGTVHWFDDFSDGVIHYDAVNQGTGAADAMVNSLAFASGYHYLLTAGSDGAHRTYIERGFGAPELDAWGIYLALWFKTEFESITVTLGHSSTTDSGRGGFKIDGANEELLYLNDALGYTKIDDIDLSYRSSPTYQHFKLVYDPNDKAYVRFLYNAEEYDLSAVDTYDGGASIFDYQFMNLYFTGRAGQNDTLALGGMVLTTGEQ